MINGYVRVSSQEQGDTKLGIDAQIKAIKDYALSNGIAINEMYIDVKSGKDTNRPELNKCIDSSLLNNYQMVVAKSCRLSRDIADGFNIRKRGIDIVILDTNIKNTMEYGIKMLFNQQEREEISRRTRLALAQLQYRGVKLGVTAKDNFTNETRKLGREVISLNAKENIRNKQATNLILIYRDSKLTLKQIADKLNDLGMLTRHGKLFNPIQVKRLYERATKGGALVEA